MKVRLEKFLCTLPVPFSIDAWKLFEKMLIVLKLSNLRQALTFSNYIIYETVCEEKYLRTINGFKYFSALA